MLGVNNFSRRDFIKRSASSAFAFSVVPSFVLGTNGQKPPSDKMNFAAIGCGGMGYWNIYKVGESEQENIVALCDVDTPAAAKADSGWYNASNTFEKYPKAAKFKDFREMLEKEGKNFDAVIIATPDHTHAVAAMACMQMGKHVFVQKPLTYDVYESRELVKAARKYNVKTQMGNQGHSDEGIRLIKEWIEDGAIGNVKEVYCWTNRPVWPQGMKTRPAKMDIPETLAWDLWVGPAAYRDYNYQYCPGAWRGWWDFGTGVLGDMGCHILDPVVWSLDLKSPEYIESDSPGGTIESPPVSSKIHYKFGPRGKMCAVDVYWLDGGLMPDRPEELEPGRQMGDQEGGCIFIGDKGKLMCGAYGRGPRLIPETKMKEYKRPAKTIARVEGGHEKDWIRACKGEIDQSSSNFDVAGQLNEVVLLGNLALRVNDRVYWDGENMKVTNNAEADSYVKRNYRQGWTL